MKIRTALSLVGRIPYFWGGKLSWSHYVELVSVADSDARSFYEQECANARWSVDELKRQIGTSLFERLLLADGQPNKERVLALARQGAALNKPEDILKQPYVFEFLGVREQKPMLEKDLEAKLIRHIEDFLLELGRGFMFVGSQQRVQVGKQRQWSRLREIKECEKAEVQRSRIINKPTLTNARHDSSQQC